MEIFADVWLVVLSSTIVVGFLMIIGKFSKLERKLGVLAEGVYDEEGFPKIEVVQQFFEVFMEDFKNLQASFENLLTKVKTLEENPSEVSEQITDLDTRIGNLAENLENLEGDVKLLLHADKEHPVLVPNKGGRPRNEKK